MRETITLDMKSQLGELFELLHRLDSKDSFYYSISATENEDKSWSEKIKLTIERVEKKERQTTTAFSLLQEAIPVLHSFGGDVVGEQPDELAMEHSRARLLLRKIKSFLYD